MDSTACPLLISSTPCGTGSPLKKSGIPPVNEFMPRQVIEFMLSNDLQERRGYIHNTSRVIDDAFLDLMSREELDGQKKLQWALTPTILFPVKNERRSKHGCLEWLDKQEPRSVIYVSFGTSVSISEDEAREMAFGLEQSKHKFLWVLRDSDRSDIFVKEARKIALPQGFEERVGQDDGMVIRDWAPQREILAHKSIGGFVTHCGWNSCYESLSFGVPIAAWPMHSDQPLNAIFMTRLLKVGFMVREWDQRGEPVRASAIKSIVERLIASEDIRKKADEISVAIQSSKEEARRELDAFIAHITRDNCDCS